MSLAAMWLRGNRFIDQGLCANAWLWAHMLAGGIGAHVLSGWLSPGNAVLSVLALAVAWEILEECWQGPSRMDAAGDIAGAVAVAALVVW